MLEDIMPIDKLPKYIVTNAIQVPKLVIKRRIYISGRGTAISCQVARVAANLENR